MHSKIKKQQYEKQQVQIGSDRPLTRRMANGICDYASNDSWIYSHIRKRNGIQRTKDNALQKPCNANNKNNGRINEVEQVHIHRTKLKRGNRHGHPANKKAKGE
jgi:hypothetical protein